MFACENDFTGIMRWKVRKTLAEFRRVATGKYVYVMFSGGRDSLIVLDLAQEIRDVAANLRVLFIDTSVPTEGLEDFVRKVSRDYFQLDVDTVSVEALCGYDYFQLVMQKSMFPTLTYRWCKDFLKIRPLEKWIQETIKRMGISRSDILLVTGVRWTESVIKRRAKRYLNHPRLLVPTYAPIIDWDEFDVSKYIYSRLALREVKDAASTRYGPGRVCDCWCSPFKAPKDFAWLKLNNERLFKKLLELETKLSEKLGRPVSALCYRNVKVFLKDIDEDPYRYLNVGVSGECPLCKLLY